MKYTLMLRCIGPMQSWGKRAYFKYRHSNAEPTKSGILGVVCAALGRPQHQSIDDLNALRMGVRVDAQGQFFQDFGTAQHVYLANRGTPRTVLKISTFIADARFLVGLEGNRTLLECIDSAFKKPHWQLYLGMKSCVPSLPFRFNMMIPAISVFADHPGLLPVDLETALTRVPPLIKPRTSAQVRLIVEIAQGNEIRNDVSRSYATREFSIRKTRTTWIDLPAISTEQAKALDLV